MEASSSSKVSSPDVVFSCTACHCKLCPPCNYCTNCGKLLEKPIDSRTPVAATSEKEDVLARESEPLLRDNKDETIKNKYQIPGNEKGGEFKLSSEQLKMIILFLLENIKLETFPDLPAEYQTEKMALKFRNFTDSNQSKQKSGITWI